MTDGRRHNNSRDHEWPMDVISEHLPIRGEYYENTHISNRIPDLAIIQSPRGPHRGFWFEVVYDSEPQWWNKTQVALRCGFAIYWILGPPAKDKEQEKDLKEELPRQVYEELTIGEFSRQQDKLIIGDPVSLQSTSYRVDISRNHSARPLREFCPKTIDSQYNWSIESNENGNWNLGTFKLGETNSRLWALNEKGTEFKYLDNNQNPVYTDREGLDQIIDSRIGPIGGRPDIKKPPIAKVD